MQVTVNSTTEEKAEVETDNWALGREVGKASLRR